MGLDDGFGNGQAQAGATGGPAARLLAAVETLEDVRQVCGCDALPSVGHVDLHAAVGGPGVHGDCSALRRVSHGVAHQVGQHAANLARIHQCRVCAWLCAAAKGYALLPGQRSKGLDSVCDQIGDGSGLPFQFQPPCVHLGQVEQVVDQQSQRLDVALRGAQVALRRLRVIDHAVGQGLDDDARRGQRCAQVMAYPGDQVAPEGVQLTLLAVRLLEPLGHLVEGARQVADLILAFHRHACGQIAFCDGFCPTAHGADAIRQGHRYEETQRHGDAAGEDQQHAGQQQVVLAGEHAPGRVADVEKGQHGRQTIAGQQRPAQPRRAAQPAQPIGAVAGKHRDQRGDRQEEGHGL